MNYNLVAYENGKKFGEVEISANMLVVKSITEYIGAIKLVAELIQSKGDFTDINVTAEQEIVKIENVTDTFIQALMEETTRKLKISWQPQ